MPRKQLIATQEGIDAVNAHGATVPWEGQPRAGTNYAICRKLGISLNTLVIIRNHMPIGPKTAAKLTDAFGDGAVEEMDS